MEIEIFVGHARQAAVSVIITQKFVPNVKLNISFEWGPAFHFLNIVLGQTSLDSAIFAKLPYLDLSRGINHNGQMNIMMNTMTA